MKKTIEQHEQPCLPMLVHHVSSSRKDDLENKVVTTLLLTQIAIL